MLDCEKKYDESKTDDIENVKGGDAESEDTKGGDSSGRVADCRDAEGGKTESEVATMENQESSTEIAERNLDCIYDDDYFFSDLCDTRTFLLLVNVGVALLLAVFAYVLVGLFNSD
ncbi:uncharacterized protein LOC143453477 isoform X2 [Clavelina lepadiformis]|uniref:uncharacterized protein LOC143453477 isoform X2 n=1 Tax=Clavelina lepadiformis TaxID=159417 RepID=UPI0040435CC1